VTQRTSTDEPLDERVRRVGGLRRFLSRPETGAVAGALIIFAFFTIVAGDKGFLAPRGIRTWLEVSAQLGIIGLGATLLMIGGQFDLSVGSMIAAAGMLFLLPVVELGWPVWLALLVVFAFALAVGFVNGTIVNRTGLPSFIVTLAFLFILRGLTLGVTRAVTGSTQVSVRSFIGTVEGVVTGADARAVLQQTFFGRLFSVELFGLPASVWWWLGLTLIAAYVLLRTPFGNWIFAVGGNPEAARNSGVPVELVRIVLFMGTAFCASILALLQVFDLGSADVTRGTLKEFEAIIVAVIGGALLTGGYGTVVGAVFGALIYGMTSQGIFIARWNTDWFRVFLGGLLLVAVIFNNFIRRRTTEVS
jgi:simple sugar transport system permease protein